LHGTPFEAKLMGVKVSVSELSVHTHDPFVISSGEVHATRSVLVEVELDGVTGLGEGSCLPPVTREDQPDALRALREHPRLEELGDFPVARAGLEMAMLDAKARKAGQPLWRYLGGSGAPPRIETDITLPILAPRRMAELAAQWWARGFRKFKVKAGHDLKADLERLEAVRAAVPQAQLQPDANGGFTLEEALAYLSVPLPFLCFEQPCETARELKELAKRTKVPIIADESVKRVEDLDALEGVSGVNLKIAKSGGLLAARELGVEAKRRGMKLMVGGMVETKLGMTAAAHLAASLGGVDFADLDTAFLLTEDPFEGGYEAEGAVLRLPESPGLSIQLKR